MAWSVWEQFVAEALQDEPDEPFVRLLRERLQAGYQLVRVNLAAGPGAPEYLVILSYRKQLQDMRVPHGPSFTRWSFEAGARLASPEEEQRRFALLLGEELEPLASEVGRDYLDAVLIQLLRRLAPPRTANALAQSYSARASETYTEPRTAASIEQALGSCARALGRSLGYSTSEAAAILDAALATFVDRRFHLQERQRLFPR